MSFLTVDCERRIERGLQTLFERDFHYIADELRLPLKVKVQFTVEIVGGLWSFYYFSP